MRGKLLTVKEVAAYLGVTRQRVEAILRTSTQGFPEPVGYSPAGRVWDGAQMAAWAEREWWGRKAWRVRPSE